MRIAMIAPPWLPVPPPAYGGTELVVDQLCRGLSAAGHEVVLFATGDSSCPVPIRSSYERPPDATIGTAAVELRHVLDAHAQARDFDVIHDHTLVGPVRAAARGDLRVVTTNHGPFEPPLDAIYREVGRAGLAIVAISERQAAQAGDIPIARVIHHGVDPAAFPIGAGEGDFVVFLGRMAPSKGLHVAIDAAREAGVPLRIAAKMRERQELDYFEAHVRPRLGKEVEYLGEVGFDEKVALLGEARALLNPIQWEEPFGMVMIEALACGTPVVTIPMGAAPEIVDHGATGYLCRSQSELVDALRSVHELDRQGCRRAVEARFSVERMVDRHVELYREVAELAPVAVEPRRVVDLGARQAVDVA